MTDYTQKTLFEKDYLIRTLGQLVRRSDLALTELIANSWDAGASKVTITIPKEEGDLLVVEDDGTGLTPDEFRDRWMRLGYNRIAHQGRKVKFPPEKSGNRKAYGKNGVGRHGMLCFNDEYKVITGSEGINTEFTIATSSEEHPFIVKNETNLGEERQGTRLEVIVKRNLPNPENMIETISARFLYDPSFTITINGKTATIEKHPGIIRSDKLEIDDQISLEIILIDSKQPHSKTLYQGIAFWQDNRLVGEPSWILGKEQVIDGRTRIAKQYSIIIQTNNLEDFIKEDWTGFIPDPTMDRVYAKISEHVDKWFSEISSKTIAETRDKVYEEFGDELSSLTRRGRLEVNEFIGIIAPGSYKIPQSTQSRIFGALINLEGSRSGKNLLQKLSVMSDEDITGLDRLLNQWTVKDALSVLDEIDKRISVIEAIDKLSADNTVDELHVLHPLLTEARWIFGPEFDSPEFTSNKSLRTAVKEIFGKDTTPGHFNNSRKRPDIVVRQDSTMGVTGTQIPNRETQLQDIDRILIIELKKGGSHITREERNQAQGYTEDISSLRSLIGNPFIHTFVVGETIDDSVSSKIEISNGGVTRGHVIVTTYSQLLDTASKRLFNLRDELEERYEHISGIDLAEVVGQQRIVV